MTKGVKNISRYTRLTNKHNNILMREFKLSKRHFISLRIALAIFIALLAFAVSLPFIEGDNSMNYRQSLILSISITLIALIAGGLSWRILRKLPYVDIAADDDGLWYLHQSKADGLVAWQDIVYIRECWFRHCLVLLDVTLTPRMRIEYQLENVEELIALLHAKRRLQDSQRNNRRLAADITYHIVHIVGACIFIGSGLYIAYTGNLWLGYLSILILVTMLMYEYSSTPYQLEVTDSRLIISYPFSRYILSLSDINTIDVDTWMHKLGRYPTIRICTDTQCKSLYLKQLGVDVHTIVAILHRATGYKNGSDKLHSTVNIH